MKILFISQSSPVPVYKDGLTVRIFHLIKEFAKHHDCFLICLDSGIIADEDQLILRELCPQRSVVRGSQTSIFSLAKKVLSERRYFDRELIQTIKSTVQKFEPDIIFAEQTFMAQYHNLFSHIPSIVSAVDAISLAANKIANMETSYLGKFAWQYVAWQRKRFEKKFLPLFDRITVVAEEDRLFLQTLLGKKVDIVPNGVDLNFFNPRYFQPINDDSNTVLFTGNLSAPANKEASIYLLTDFFPKIHTLFPAIRLCIAGRAPPEEIINLCPDYVTIMSDLPDIRIAFEKARLYIAPIQFGTGIKNNILQAMALGIPILTTKECAQSVAITNGYNGFVAGRGNEMIAMTSSIIKDTARLKKVGMQGRENVERLYSWESVSARYLSIFREMLEASKLSNTKTTFCIK